MNKGGECRIKKEKEEVEENKCNNFYISDFICIAGMVQQFQKRRSWRSQIRGVQCYLRWYCLHFDRLKDRQADRL